MINGADLPVTEVCWPGYLPLFQVGTLDAQRAMDVMQVHLWSPIMRAWIKLVPRKLGEPGVIEGTPGDTQDICGLETQGVPKVEAIRRVLGWMPS